MGGRYTGDRAAQGAVKKASASTVAWRRVERAIRALGAMISEVIMVSRCRYADRGV